MTSIATTAAEALAGGRGVCQDTAHVMIALCRAAGLPARYVSGHLLGEGGTHAWVEVIVADACRCKCGGVRPVQRSPRRQGLPDRRHRTRLHRGGADLRHLRRQRPRHADRHQTGRRRAGVTVGLVTTTSIGRPPRGPVGCGEHSSWSRTSSSTSPHPGHAAAVSSRVTTCTTRAPSDPSRHAAPPTPVSPNRAVVPCSKARGPLSRCREHSETQVVTGLDAGAPSRPARSKL